MSRPIKFRGLPIEDYGPVKWFYGSAIMNYEDKLAYIEADGQGTVPIIWDTVGQYTGLHDRNGKEIYEGDIVYTPQFDWTGYVVFTGDCQYALKGKTELGNDGYVLFTQIYLNECEVIGNIYEHPHLQKGVVEDA
ncbi:YopX family protein [Bacillus cereus]|uniref:YopX family protein n=1 Tax=Paenibacillus melissococcoides TaxID=2912268 RepID=UPI002DC28E18|nr:YopX family protein [Bacillus cereus]